MTTNIRTTVRDAVLANVSGGLDGDAVEGIEETSISATESACKTSPLLNWDEYRKVSL